MRKTFGASPTPNQMITRGTSPRIGTARNAWMTGSMRSSPSQNRPHSTASNTPAPTPSSSPSATLWREMSRLDWSTPWAASSRAASKTATGEAISKLVNSPREQTSCHSAMAAIGPMARRASRGIRMMATRRCLARAGRMSVRPPVPGTAPGARTGPGARVPSARAVAPAPGAVTPAWSAILGDLVQEGVVPGRLGRAVQRGHGVGRGERAAAGHQVDHLLQGTLHPGVDGHVGEGPAGGENQLRHLWSLVLDVDVVVGDPLGLVRFRPVLGLDQPLDEVLDGGLLGLVRQRRGGGQHVAIAGRLNAVDRGEDLRAW